MCRHALTMGEIFKAEPFQPAATREGSAKEEEDELELGEESNSLPVSQMRMDITIQPDYS